ncbi:response regulator transcription factor [Candidatus Pacearchaeota archaeon]|nr:response regulator transcription factor [Candidatus Pacearchaeota archaeon]
MEVIAMNRLEEKSILIVGRIYLQNNLLASYLEKKTGFISKVVEFESLVKYQKFNTQLLLLDCNDINGSLLTTVIDSLNSDFPVSKIALFNVKQNSPEEESAALPIIKGIFYRDATENQLANGIKAVIDGELWLSRRLISKFYTNKNQCEKKGNQELGLTEREIQIINMISNGAQNKEIAKKLCLSNHTIKTHIYHIYKKLKVSNRTQASNWAQQHLILRT